MFDILLQQIANGLTIGMAYALVATGLALIFGIMGIINFAHGEFYMLGAYGVVLAMQYFGISYFWAIPVAVLGVMVIGYVTQKLTVDPLRKTHHFNVLLSTFALSIGVYSLVSAMLGSFGKQVQTPLSGVVMLGPVVLTDQKIFVLTVGVFLLTGLVIFLKYTPIGKLMRCTAQNRFAAMVIGVNVRRIELFTFSLGIALAALGGALLSPLSPVVPEMGRLLTLKAFTVIVVGGMGNVGGAIVVAFMLGIMETLATGYFSSAWRDVITYSLLILVLLIRPTGLFGGTQSH